MGCPVSFLPASVVQGWRPQGAGVRTGRPSVHRGSQTGLGEDFRDSRPGSQQREVERATLGLEEKRSRRS